MVRRGLGPSNGTSGFPPNSPSCAPLTSLGCQSSRTPRVKGVWEIQPRRTRSPLTPTCPVGPESNSLFICLPSSPPTEQRCLREHLELVVLHPPHHHRLLFYAEPRAGCAVGVSLCCFPIRLSRHLLPREGPSKLCFHSLQAGNILPLLWVSQTVISNPCIGVWVVQSWGNPVKGLVRG